jgi:hypothetical protein
MTTAPYVELRVNPTDLRPGDLPKAGEFLGTPADAIEAALAMTRAAMVDQMKGEIRGIGQPTHYQLMRIADLAWQAGFWRFRKVSAPIIADAYLHAYQAADAGDVPMSVIYDLADKHAEKVGMYFHETSRQALSEGFNSMVNRQIPARVAADRVLDAYGLTPRQMRGFVANKQFNTPIMDIVPRALKERARAYVDRAFTQRTRKLSRQEEHNIDEQAKQFAWMWLQDKGQLNERAQKLWITARDERVCPVCGPLHGRKVLVNEQFKTAHGDFWSPGLHPNCRCVVRLIENRFTLAKALGGADLYEFNQEHPRGYDGRFGTKTRTRVGVLDVDEEFDRLTQGMTMPDTDPQQDLKFAEIAQYSWLPPARARATPSLPATYAVVGTEAPVETEVWTPVVEPKTEVTTEVKTKAPARTRAPAKPALKPITPVQVKTKLGLMRWAVPSYEMYDADGRKIQLNRSDITYATRQQAEAAASEEIRARVDARVAQIVEAGATFTDYRGHQYALHPKQVNEVAEYAARRAQIDAATTLDPPGMDITMPLRVRELDASGEQAYDERGNPIVAGFSLPVLRSQLSLRDEDFAVPIVSIDRSLGHTPKRADSELDDRYFKPVPEFEGNYRARERGWATGQEFNALHLEAKPMRATPLPKRD